MDGVPRCRCFDEDPPYYDDPDKFTVVLENNGFFCGLKANLQYVTGIEDCWDNCSIATFSLLWIEEFIRAGGNEVNERTSVYWILPGTEMKDGMCLIENDADILAMMNAVKDEKKLFLMVDHSNFIKGLRDVIIPIPSKYRGQNDIDEEVRGSRQLSSVMQDSESGNDSDFYDINYDAEDGDDDLFLDNVDSEVHDHNEQIQIVVE
ncbi:hypothetical protein ACQ4PT_009091 [Festuca glaucescens]